MSVAKIASRYAKSLLDLAVEQKKVDKVADDINSFLELTKIKDFANLLKSPIIMPSKKEQTLKAVLGGKVDELTMIFINTVVKKGRESFLPDIAIEFQSQYKKLKHITTAKVTSAVPLSNDTLKMIKEKILAKAKDKDEQFELIAEVDPSLLGGFIIEFDDNVYDTSLSHKLVKMKKEFVENLYVSQVIAK